MPHIEIHVPLKGMAMAETSFETPILDAIIDDLVERNEGSYVLAMRSIRLDDLEPVPTEELLLVLADAGLASTEEELAEVVPRHTISDGVYDELVDRCGEEPAEDDELPFLALMILCARLFPDWVSVDNFVDRVGDAFGIVDARILGQKDVGFTESVRALGRAWEMAVKLAEAWGVRSVAEFDRKSEARHSIADLAQFLDEELELGSLSDAAMADERRAFIQEFARLFGRDSVRVLEADVEPDGSIMAEYEMYMEEPTGTVFDGIIDDELLDMYPYWE
jgi:hypothetical protein